jgi:hypothetical protein
LPWRPDIFLPVDPDLPRNGDRLDPAGDRIRLRLNREGGRIVDFVVQYETPTVGAAHSHAVVLRSDLTHAPHVDRYDRFGGFRQEWLPPHLSPEQMIDWVVDDIRKRWRSLRRTFYRGLR